MNSTVPSPDSLKHYKDLYVWMLGPLLIVQISIFNYYWPKFSIVSWEIHFHYWLVTSWYCLLILQPFLATKGKLDYHRTLGLIGFVIAGGVLFTGISLLDIPLRLAENAGPDRPGPPVSFFYGTLVIEFISILAFAYAVIQSILNRFRLQDHSWWLICTAFYMMSPALGRGMITFWRNVLPPEDFSPVIVFASSEVIYIVLFVIFIIRFGRWKHMATYIGFALIIVRLLRIPLGASESVQALLKAIIQY